MRIICFLLVLLTMFSCDDNSLHERHREWMDSNGKLKVLCTTVIIKDVVEGVGGEYIDVISLINGGLDPHSYELVKGDNEKFQCAEVIFSNGLGLESGTSLQYLLLNLILNFVNF